MFVSYWDVKAYTNFNEVLRNDVTVAEMFRTMWKKKVRTLGSLVRLVDYRARSRSHHQLAVVNYNIGCNRRFEGEQAD